MYLLTKVILAVMLGFISSALIGLVVIPLFKHFHIGQKINAYTSHSSKEGTPTMGGLIFIISTLLVMSFLLITHKIDFSNELMMVMFVFISYAIIGFLDDYLSLRKGKNEGLTIVQKLLLQLIVAIIFFYLYMNNNGQTTLEIATLGIKIEMKWLYGLFILLILVGSSNAVNLTDGLDGLAAGLSAIAMIAFSLISLTVGYTDMGIFALILTGTLIGFLVYNGYPAKIFMGDTGSLSLGAVMGAIEIIVALVFVLETLSVILQVFWYKTFKKRIFLMTPIHHHFEKLGWHEIEIVRFFWVFGFIFAMAGIIFGVWI